MANGSSAGDGLPDVQPFGEAEDVRLLEQGADEDGDANASGEEDGEGEENEHDEREEGQEEDGEGEGEGQEEEGEEDQEGEQDTGRQAESETPGRPTLRAIKEKYPNIFKEFPDLRAVLFREAKFGEHFATVEEAQEAATDARNFQIISQSLADGSAELLLTELNKNNPDALKAVAGDFLGQLEKISRDLYLEATVPVVEDLLWKVVQAAERSGDKNLKFSAQHINRFLFGDVNVREPKPKENPEVHPAEKKLQEERANWQRERFNEARTSFTANVDRRLEAAIVQGLDPNNALKPYLRKALIRDIREEVAKALASDEAHVRNMNSLWKRAANSGFAKDQIASIENAFLARAKQVVPGIRNKLRAEALGKEQREAEDRNAQPKKKSIPAGAGTRGASARVGTNPKAIDYNKTSDMDIILDRETPRQRR